MARNGHRAYYRNRDRLKARATVCALCGHPIDHSLPIGHPRSFNADHIIPLSKGGTHDYSNLRASHQECNLQRGDKQHAPAQDKRRFREW